MKMLENKSELKCSRVNRNDMRKKNKEGYCESVRPIFQNRKSKSPIYMKSAFLKSDFASQAFLFPVFF